MSEANISTFRVNDIDIETMKEQVEDACKVSVTIVSEEEFWKVYEKFK